MAMLSDPSTLASDTFDALAAIAQDESGLQLVPEKRLMVQSRLKPRLRALRLPSFESYVSHVRSETGQPELRHMISALTTNVTQFFREKHHFDLLTDRLLPILERKVAQGERVRIWSAGCSRGQEPYSIAMHLLNALPALADTDFRILATDIDPRVVSFARTGQYDAKEVSAVPKVLADAFLRPVADSDQFEMDDLVKRHITFKELNLMHPWPMRGRFDAIFCRNVVIYFKSETQDVLWPRFASALQPEGLLFLGHSERIGEAAQFGLKNIGTTTYALETGCMTRSNHS
ncbi:protein-glutamate O-methyltransferase [uncultured Tateyamaria sp.]|uniref:CheR family methyltransferase n=1 Tax=Tateyamaria sp. 1078 TaxID=3417464 RepID=UPI00260B83A3|nr:protein-glutamate O-methyltransferase [uncultured Tateyamaria sp.]